MSRRAPSLVRFLVGKQLSKAGFTKAGSRWVRELAELYQVVQIMRSHFGAYYFVDLAVVLKETAEYYGVLDTTLCDIGTRVENLAPNGREFVDACSEYLPLDLSTREEVIGRWFRQQVIPFFDRYSRRDALLALARIPSKQRSVFDPAVYRSLKYAVEPLPPGKSRYYEGERFRAKRSKAKRSTPPET